MDRRETLRTIVGVAVLPALGMLGPGELLALGSRVHARAGQPWRVLDPRTSAIVRAAAECIIPATDTPGAGDAGVAGFVDVMLADWYAPAERERLLAGLADLGTRGFVGLDTGKQTALLQALDTEVATRQGGAQAEHWFAMLKFLTLWGYYTSEVAQTRELGLWPLPGRYDACAPYRA